MNTYKKALKIINRVGVRSKNNKNWMDLLRLSLKLDHKTSTKILSEIYKEDQKVSNLAKKLYQLK